MMVLVQSGNKGIGESVWLGFFLYNVLERFIPLCKQKEDDVVVEKYEKVMDMLKQAVNTNAWDGRWYKRAYTDDGKVIGSMQNEEARIDSIAQSWSVISGAGEEDKQKIAMEEVENQLIDEENSVIKLLDPPFEKGDINPGYIKSYLPGVRENGGQYTHAALWAVWAITLLSQGDKATKYYKYLTPIEHSRTREISNKYKVEPYAIVADMYGNASLIGRGGWTWYTGSSSWYFKIGIEEILGLKIQNGILSINPCIESTWKEYTIKYKFKNSIYNIKVKNPNNKQTGVISFKLNGQEIESKQIKLIDDGRINEIDVVM